MASRYTDEERQRITNAVQRAESKTSAEIVPVIALASDGYDRPEDVAGLWLAALAIAAVWFVVPPRVEVPGSWEVASSWIWLVLLLTAALVAFFGGAFAASQFDWLRKVFTPKSQMEMAVRLRASQVFFDNRIHHTDCGTGVLIYLSLYEGRAVILGDETVTEKIGTAGLERICAELTAAMKSGQDAISAVCSAITVTGDELAATLPRLSGDQNELKNVLVELGKP